MTVERLKVILDPAFRTVEEIFDAVITTPHIAGALPEALRQIGRRLVADLRSIAEHETPRALQYLTHNNLAGLRQA